MTTVTETRYNLVNGLPSVDPTGVMAGVRKEYDNGDIEDVLVYKMDVNYMDKSILCYVKEFLTIGRTGKTSELTNLTGLYRNGMFVANEETWVSLVDGSFHSPRPTKTLWTNITTQEVVEVEPLILVDEFGVDLYTLSYENLPNFITQYAYFDGILGSAIRGFQGTEMEKRANYGV